LEEDRLLEAGFEPEGEDERVRATDPSGNAIVLRAR
jgi:hypothetical protein